MTDAAASQTSSGTHRAGASEDKNIVLIAFDGSEHSFNALDWYLTNLHKSGSDVFIAHCSDYKDLIWTPVMSADSSALSTMIQHFERETNNALEQAQKRMTDVKVNAKLLRLSGDSGSAIVKAAKEYNVNYIVTGSRGLGKIRRTFIGSVSSYIVHHAHCPVLVCQSKSK